MGIELRWGERPVRAGYQGRRELDRRTHARNAEAQLTDPSKVMPNGGFKLIGSYEKVAAMLDQFGSTPGIKGIMLIFDDFIAA